MRLLSLILLPCIAAGATARPLPPSLPEATVGAPEVTRSMQKNGSGYGLPLVELLDDRGQPSRQIDYSGPIDVRGWTVVSAKDEPLRFARSGGVELDGQWQPGYHAHRGCNGEVRAMVRAPGGEIYLGGRMDHCGGVRSRNLFVFDQDSQQFSGVGGGVGGSVNALALHQGQLIVGGMFTEAGNVPVNHLARWTGSQWQSVVGGVQRSGGGAQVHALASVDGSLYVGGRFDQAGSISALNIASLQTGVWCPMVAGTNGEVYALEHSGSLLFVGGGFTQAGGASARNLARWDGVAWNPVGAEAGLPAAVIGSRRVYALRVVGTQLWVGGDFFSGDNSIRGLLRWDSVADTWDSVWGAEMSFPSVYALSSIGSTVYIGGDFRADSAPQRRNVVAWNNGQWLPMHQGAIEGEVWSLLPVAGQMLVGGGLRKVDAEVMNGLAAWNGNTLQPAVPPSGLGINSRVNALLVFQGDLIVAGDFTAGGGLPAVGVLRRTASGWEDWSAGLTGGVSALGIHANQLVAAQSSSEATRVLRWNGSDWQSLGETFTTTPGGSSGGITALASFGGDLYAAGFFLWVGSTAANNIARWNGTAWEPVQSIGGNGVNSTVAALHATAGGLLVGGAFTVAGGVPAERIARWDGSAWSALGEGFNDTVNDIAVRGATLFAGGLFTASGATPMERLAVWNGAQWTELGGGISDPRFTPFVAALSATAEGLWVSGRFADAGGLRVNNIALWDGAGWRAAGAGDDRGIPDTGAGLVQALVPDGNRIHAAGTFAVAGATPSWNYAVFDQTPRPPEVFSDGFESSAAPAAPTQVARPRLSKGRD